MSNLPRGRNADYWEGRRAEAARLEALETARLAARVGRVAARDAQEIARDLRRDAALKQRILARHPWGFYGMDAQELGEASATELALYELRQLGIVPPFDDPVKLLNALHASPAFQQGIRNGARLLGREGGRDNVSSNFLVGGWPDEKRPGVGSEGTEEKTGTQKSSRDFLEEYLRS